MAQQQPGQGQPVPAATWDEHVKKTIATLHAHYLNYIRPLEDRFKYDQFHPTWYEETILNQKPFITFFGPWSAGKSTFINHLLQENYMWTGPQPTTAEFTAIVYGDDAGPVDGRVLANSKDHPFRGLNEFGEAFLENFKGFQAPHELLKSVTLIDTPGVLESTQEVHQRKYDYIKLARWFAERSDLIFCMFDPTKLDSGVELKMMFARAFKGQESKIRIVLNKADTVNTQELMRVYGSLFWNLSNLINTTEPPRVFTGSFWDQPYQPGTFHLLFSEEKADLLHELTDVIPVQALDKKVASLIRRAKDVFIHAIIVGGMRQDLPMLFGKDKAKKKAMDELQQTYEKVAAQYKMNWRDFPPVDDYRRFLEKFDLETFPSLKDVDKEGMLQKVGSLIDTVLPRLLKPVKQSVVADPTNKDRRAQLQSGYNQTIENQVKGVGGRQGSSDVVQTGIRQNHFGHVQRDENQQQQQLQIANNNGNTNSGSASASSQNLSPQQPASPAMPNMNAPSMPSGGNNNNNNNNPQMMQMMQMMMQNGNMNPQMMQMMMGMMNNNNNNNNNQQQQPQSPAAPAPAPAPEQPQQQQQQPAAGGGMDQNAMMMQMMQQMQQQQQNQANPATQPEKID